MEAREHKPNYSLTYSFTRSLTNLVEHLEKNTSNLLDIINGLGQLLCTKCVVVCLRIYSCAYELQLLTFFLYDAP